MGSRYDLSVMELPFFVLIAHFHTGTVIDQSEIKFW